MQTVLKYNCSISLANAAYIEIMHEHGINRIVSFGSDFDKVNWIGRIR